MVAKKKAVAVADPIIVVDELVMDKGRFEVIPLNLIRISKTNRKHFDQLKLTELAASIKDIGVAQPILIRTVTPTEAEPEIYEIVAGERRFLASKIAGVTTIPAMIRNLTDLQAAKIQILENLQREDPHELEEALGYQALMLAHGYSADQLVTELNKSRSYIYGRLKLCSLAEPLHDDFLNRKFSSTIALYVARIPVPTLQVKAMRHIMGTDDSNEPMSSREAKEYLETYYTLDLDDAPFDTKDAKLIDSPSCIKCPMRTGNQPEIFTDIGKNICTNPDCFAEKKAATLNAKILQLEKQNIPVFQGKLAEMALRSAVNANNLYVTKNTFLRAFPRARSNLENNTIYALITTDKFPPADAYAKTECGTLIELYETQKIQNLLEDLSLCASGVEAFNRGEERAEATTKTQDDEADSQSEVDVNIGGATLSTTYYDPYIERLKREDFAKAKAEKETKFRVALYKRIRLTGFNNLTVESLRELTKNLLSSYAIPDDMLADLYPFGTSGSDEAVIAYIDQANKDAVLNVMLDLLLGEAFSVSWMNPSDTGEYHTLIGMANAEGIDLEQFRVDLDKPVDATPVKRPTLSIKKKAHSANEETAGAA